MLEGAFSLVLLDGERLYGVRDPNGFRPLCLGRLDGGWVLASETPALDIVGATFVRELEPGEVVVIDRDGPRSLHPFAAERIEPRLCLFEFVYFARPDAQLYGRNVDAARVRMGEQLADQAPLPPDRHQPARPAMVMPVPESGVPAAQGFARASGIPYGDGLVKNRYIGRTFIAPSQELRALGVRLKLNPLRENIEGKRLVVVDDSIVRGTTTRAVVAMLRESGAAEVHLRIMSPPYRWPCFYGMDTGDPDELLAARLDRGRDPRLRRRRLPRLPRPSTGSCSANGVGGRALLRRLPHGQLPGGGPGHAAQGRARGPLSVGETYERGGGRASTRPTRWSSGSSRHVRSTFGPGCSPTSAASASLVAVPARLPASRSSSAPPTVSARS